MKRFMRSSVAVISHPRRTITCYGGTEFDLDHVMPMHCSGQNFVELAAKEMPEKLVLWWNRQQLHFYRVSCSRCFRARPRHCRAPRRKSPYRNDSGRSVRVAGTAAHGPKPTFFAAGLNSQLWVGSGRFPALPTYGWSSET